MKQSPFIMLFLVMLLAVTISCGSGNEPTGQPQGSFHLDYARQYKVVSEGNVANEDSSRSVGLWFITSEEASGFEEYAQTAVQAVLDLYRLYGRDFTSVLLIQSDGLEYAGLTCAQANFAADGKGAAGMTGSAPAKEGFWIVRAAGRELNEQELAIAELWKGRQQDFPQPNPWSSLSYDQEALRRYIADTLKIPYDEVQMPYLEMREYELDKRFVDWTRTLVVNHIQGNSVSSSPLPPVSEQDNTPIPTPALSHYDQTIIYATIIRQLATVDDTFGGKLKPPILYIIRETDDKAGNPTLADSFSILIPQSEQNEITDILCDLSADIIWIDKFEDADFEKSKGAGLEQLPEQVKGGGAVITLGNIRLQRDGSAQVSGSIWVANLAAGGTTYTLEKKDGAWKISGTSGARWMS